MYLYFDVNGNLKEIINHPVRQGDDNANKIYIYLERSTNKSVEIIEDDYSDYNWESTPTESKVNVYMLPSATVFDSWFALFKITDSNTILNPEGYGDTIDDSNIIKQLPYDKERDLKYFQYFKYYQFIEIDLTSDITQYNGRCDCTVSMIKDETTIMNLDTFSFFIQGSVVMKDVQITYAQYQYLYSLVKHAEVCVPYTGATSNVNLGNYAISASGFAIIDDTDVVIYTGEGVKFISGTTLTGSLDLPEVTGSKTIATTAQLPSKAVCGQFNTSSFVQTAGGYYAAEDIPLHGFIDGSDIIVITWDNCFAICPIPAVPEADGRVCAAMWNASGEAQTIRIRYSVTDNNSLCNISLQGGFTPPSNHTAYVICYKLITQ